MRMTVGSVVGATLTFLRNNPRLILAWAVVSIAASLPLRLIMEPLYRAQAEALAPPEIGFGRILLLGVGIVALVMILYSASYRAIVRPDDDRAFYLRLGRDELRFLGLLALVWLGSIVATVICVILLLLIGGGLAWLLGTGQGTLAAIAILTIFPLYAAMIFVSVRLAPAGPLTLLHRRIVIRRAWALTRGSFWRLLGAALTLLLISIAIWLPTLLLFPSSFVIPSASADPQERMLLYTRMAETVALQPSLSGVVQLLVGGIVGAVGIVLYGCGLAIATMQLIDEKDGAPASP